MAIRKDQTPVSRRHLNVSPHDCRMTGFPEVSGPARSRRAVDLITKVPPPTSSSLNIPALRPKLRTKPEAGGSAVADPFHFQAFFLSTEPSALDEGPRTPHASRVRLIFLSADDSGPLSPRTMHGEGPLASDLDSPADLFTSE